MKHIITLQRIKPWVLPGAMICGIFLHNYMGMLEWSAPWLIFIMLFITFCRVKPSEMKIDSMTLTILAVQLGGATAVYFALLPFGDAIAQGAMICVFCPTATAAPVITGMLGGSVPRLVAYSLASNLTVAVCAPLVFSGINGGSVDLFSSTVEIAKKVFPLIVAPLICALLLMKISPKAHATIAKRQSWSFYIWAVSLFIVVGRAVSFVMSEPPAKIPTMIAIGVIAGVMCGLQFYAGRKIGARFGDKIAGAQGLGQKNTVLAIWMALTYLNPISSVGPAAYIAWQNTVNSLQLYYKEKRERRNQE
ncbi:MAG: transporter [Paramuribaculum sp.]|nr:transporter [Paramuribaculum sp.]